MFSRLKTHTALYLGPWSNEEEKQLADRCLIKLTMWEAGIYEDGHKLASLELDPAACTCQVLDYVGCDCDKNIRDWAYTQIKSLSSMPINSASKFGSWDADGREV